MSSNTPYLESRIGLAEGRVEGWKTDYCEAQLIWDLEDIYKDVLHMVEDVFDRDEQVHFEAAKGGDSSAIDAWSNRFKAVAGRMMKLISWLKTCAQESKAHHYNGCIIDVAKLDQCEKRLWGVVAPSDEYLERGDVRDAIEQAEAGFRAGHCQHDPIKPS